MRTSVSRRVLFLAALLSLAFFTSRGFAEKAKPAGKTAAAKTQAATAEATEGESTAGEESDGDTTTKKKSKAAKKATTKSKSKSTGSGTTSSASSAQTGATGTSTSKGSTAVTAGGFPQLSSGAFGAAAASGSGSSSGTGAGSGSASGASSGSSSKNCKKETSSTSTTDDADEEASALSDDLQKLVNLTNDERRNQNLAPLTVNPILTKMAAEHSANMARLNIMSHTLEGVTFQQRLERSGYKASTAGENVAAGQTSVEQALKDWMNSPGHRANILNPNFTEIGVGIAKSSTGVAYYTQEFGAPQ